MPIPIKNTLRSVYYEFLPHFIQLRSQFVEGCLPDFYIVGVQKGGTTSLYNYLLQHENIATALRKEIHYFDRNYERGIEWYKSHFNEAWKLKTENCNVLTGECTPYYAYHPLASKMIAELTPAAKIIFILREPTARAVSHYKHNVSRGKYKNDMTLSRALSIENDILVKETKKMLASDNRYNEMHDIYSIRDRGVYVNQILNYRQAFPLENIHVLFAEELFQKPDAVLSDLCGFLKLSDYSFNIEKIYNKNTQSIEIDENSVSFLKEYYQDHNEQLASLLNRKLPW